MTKQVDMLRHRMTVKGNDSFLAIEFFPLTYRAKQALSLYFPHDANADPRIQDWYGFTMLPDDDPDTYMPRDTDGFVIEDREPVELSNDA